MEQARKFRTTHRSQLTVYRCRCCDQTYNLYTGTLLEQHHLRPEQVVLFLRGMLKGESSKILASELSLSYKTVLTLRHQLQDRVQQLHPDVPLADAETETDEMFQNAGEKRNSASCPLDPPRRRAHKQSGRGTYNNDRPPIVGTVGRTSGEVRLRVVKDTTGETLVKPVHQFTLVEAQFTPMNLPVTITLFGIMPRFVTATRNGQEMMTVMEFEKYV